MIFLLRIILSIIIFCPIVLLIGLYFIGKKTKQPQEKALGYATDATTAVLFFSVPLAVKGIWEISIFIPTVLFAVVVAAVLTYIDWRTKKEILIMPLLKKIWRMYFILLGVLYFFIWVMGLIYSTLLYMDVI